jgi:hypothetical protein
MFDTLFIYLNNISRDISFPINFDTLSGKLNNEIVNRTFNEVIEDNKILLNKKQYFVNVINKLKNTRSNNLTNTFNRQILDLFAHSNDKDNLNRRISYIVYTAIKEKDEKTDDMKEFYLDNIILYCFVYICTLLFDNKNYNSHLKTFLIELDYGNIEHEIDLEDNINNFEENGGKLNLVEQTKKSSVINDQLFSDSFNEQLDELLELYENSNDPVFKNKVTSFCILINYIVSKIKKIENIAPIFTKEIFKNERCLDDLYMFDIYPNLLVGGVTFNNHLLKLFTYIVSNTSTITPKFKNMINLLINNILKSRNIKGAYHVNNKTIRSKDFFEGSSYIEIYGANTITTTDDEVLTFYARALGISDPNQHFNSLESLFSDVKNRQTYNNINLENFVLSNKNYEKYDKKILMDLFRLVIVHFLLYLEKNNELTGHVNYLLNYLNSNCSWQNKLTDEIINDIKHFNTVTISGGNDDYYMSNITGGVDNSYDMLKEALPENSKYTVKISEKLKSLKYYIRVAAIKENIKNVQGELEKDSNHYNNMTSEMIAEKIKQLNNLKDNCIAALPNLYQNDNDKIKSFTKFYNDEYQVKRNLLEAAQALDSQLKLVTENIVKNPETLQEIKNMITDADIISYWYDESSGNKLCELFELFNENNKVSISTTEHYFNSIIFTGKISLIDLSNQYLNGNNQLLTDDFYKNIYYNFLSLTKNFIVSDLITDIENTFNTNQNNITIPTLLYLINYGPYLNTLVPINLDLVSNDNQLRGLNIGFGRRYDNFGAGNLTNLFLNSPQNYLEPADEFYFIRYDNYQPFKYSNMFKYPLIPAITKAMSLAGINLNSSNDTELIKKFLVGFSVPLSIFILFPDRHTDAPGVVYDSIDEFDFSDGANTFVNAITDFLTLMNANPFPDFNNINISNTYTAQLANKQAAINNALFNGYSYDIMYRYLAEEMNEFLKVNSSSYDNIIKNFYIKMVNAISKYMSNAGQQFCRCMNNVPVTLNNYSGFLRMIPKNNTPIVNSIPILAYEAIKNCTYWSTRNDAQAGAGIVTIIRQNVGGVLAGIAMRAFTFENTGKPFVLRITNYYNSFINNDTLSSVINFPAPPVNPNYNSIKFFNKMKTTLGHFVDPLNVNTYPDLLKSVKSVFSSQAMLKNIIEIFLKIGGYKETSNSMHPKLLYSRLLDYCIRSSIDVLTSNNLNQGQALINAPVNNLLGIRPNNFLNYPGVNQEGIILTTASRFSQYNRYNDTFEGEDEIFELMMKSIVAKIFTILGVSDLFDRPVGTTKPTALRLLIGGNEQSTDSSIYASGSISGGNEIPVIYDDIADLYVKLMLYLEFYKDIFKPENIPNNGIEISMIPDINNTFTKVIDIVFNKNNGNDTGNYSTEDIKDFVKSVNDIYDKHKDSSKNAEQITKLIISNLVNEVNRRYGILTDTDARDYVNDKYLLYQMSDPTGNNNTKGYDSALLPDDDLDESQIGFNAPSNKYLPDNLRDLNKTVYKLNEVRLDDQLVPNSRRYVPNTWRMRVEALERFRNALSLYFNNSGYNLNDDIDLSDKIRSLSHIKRDLANAKTPQDRFNVISQTMLGDDFTSTSNQVRYIMFHEMVVTNLTILKKIYSLLAGLRISLHKLRNIETDINVFRTNLTNIINNNYPAVGSANNIYTLASNNVAYLDKQSYLNRNFVIRNANQYINNNVYLPNISFLTQLRNTLNIDDLMQRMPNYSDNFVKLVNYCSLLSCEFQGLVKCNVSNSRINISFGSLGQKIVDLFSDTKRNIDLFSGILPKSVIQPFEDRKRPGSLYWLNTHLIDDLIRGVEYRLNTPGNRSITINQMSSIVSNISRHLIGELKNNRRNNLGDALVKLTYFNPLREENNNEIYLNDLSPSSSILKSTLSSLNYSTNNRVSVLYSFGDGINDPILSANGNNVSNKSLVCQFNDTLAKFLKANTDSSNYKIYKPLINDLINSTFSEQIMGTKRICDGLFDIQGFMLSEINKVKITGSRDNGLDVFKSICQSIGVDGINFIPDIVHGELGNRWTGLALMIRNVPVVAPLLAGGLPAVPITLLLPPVAPPAANANTFIPPIMGAGVGPVPVSPQSIVSVNNFDINTTINGLYLNTISIQIDSIINSLIFPVNGQLIFQDTLLNIWKTTINQIKANIGPLRLRNNATHNGFLVSDPVYLAVPLSRDRLINLFKYSDTLYRTNNENTFRNIAPLNGAPLTVGSIGVLPAPANGILALTTLIYDTLMGMFNLDPYISTQRNTVATQFILGQFGAFNFNNPTLNVAQNTAIDTEIMRVLLYNNYITNAPIPKNWKAIFTLIEIMSTLFHLSPALAHFSYMVLGLFPDTVNSRFGVVIHKNLDNQNVARIGTKIYCGVSGTINPKGAAMAGGMINGASFNDALINNISILIAIKIALLLKCKLPFDYVGYPRSLHEFIGNFINGDDVIRSFFTLRLANPNVNLFDAYNESSMFMATVEHLTAYLETLAPSDPASMLSYSATEYKRSIVAIKVQFRYELIKHIQVDALAPFIFGIPENNYRSVKQDKLSKFARNSRSIGSTNNSNLAMELTLPSEGCALFLSLSEILKQYITEKDFKDNTKYRFMADSISELNTSLQEKMSINLPYFEKMFSQLIKRANIIKNIAQINGLQVLVGSPLNVEEDMIIDGKQYLKVMATAGMPYKDPLFNTGNDINIKNNIIAACDDVINGSVELIKSINSVVGELASKTEFFEFRNGFIGNYQNINNKLPFMPLSQLTHSLKPVFVDINTSTNNPNCNLLMPRSEIDNNMYKYLHGCRYLMTKYNISISLEKMQGVRDLFSKLISNSSLMISEESFKKSVENTLTLLRFASDINIYGLLSYSSLFEEIIYLDLWVNQKSNNNIETVNTYQTLDNPARHVGHMQNFKRIIENQIGQQDLNVLTTYLVNNSNTLPGVFNTSPDTNTEAVINVTNNNNQSTEYDNIKNVITNVVNQDHNRKWLIVQNILEVNIIPINIHMLQRDIPLIYLLNYSYTFDHMVQEFTRNYNNNKSMGPGALQDRSDEIYTKLLLNPYGFMEFNVYTKSYSALVRGQTSIGFGRLKFIGDQLFNKCLLNTLYYRNPNNEYDIPAQRNNDQLNIRYTNTYTDLYYPDPNNPGQWGSIIVSRYIIYVGYQRFHSKIVRHLHFLTLLQHLILHKLGKELEDHDDIVIKSYPIVDPTITQFRGQEMWTDDTHKMSSYDRRPNRRVVPFSVINP